MQTPSNMKRDSVNNESKSTNGNHDDNQVPPPSYTSIIYTLKNSSFQSNYNIALSPPSPPPPCYVDINNLSVVCINNYPGPPLEDGIVQRSNSNPVTIHQPITIKHSLSKEMQLYLNINGALMILLGLIIIGLQIGLVKSHSIIYYYCGFWAGALIILAGIGTVVFSGRSYSNDLKRCLRCFIWQAIFIVVVFSFVIIIIIIVNRCNGQASKDDDKCTNSYKVLNGVFLVVAALAFLQSTIHAVAICILKRRYVNYS